MKLLTKYNKKVIEIPARKIRPNKTQPRQDFYEEDLRSLSQSISNNGLLQPLTVRKLKMMSMNYSRGEKTKSKCYGRVYKDSLYSNEVFR